MRFGPSWLPVALVTVLVVAAVVARRWGHHRTNERIGYALLIVLTAGLMVGIANLLLGVLRHSQPAGDLLRSASILWITNVIVFASWYWRIDAGGPNARERRVAHTRGAFLFPQMSVESPDSEDGESIAENEGWRPEFIDYLFVAFNTSTAFSPTDAPVFSRWAKGAMMVQSTISFTTVVLLAARAVNML